MCNQHYSESSSRLVHSTFTSTDEQELLLNLFVGAPRGEVTCLRQLSQLVLTQLVWFQCVQPESLHHSAALLLVTILEPQDRCLSRLGAKMCQSRSSTGEWEPRKDWLRNQNSQLPVKKLLDRGSQAPACVQSLLDLGKVNTKVPGTGDFSAYVWGCPILEGGQWEETTDIENVRTQHFSAEELHQLLCWPISESLTLKWFSWSITEVKEAKRITVYGVFDMHLLTKSSQSLPEVGRFRTRTPHYHGVPEPRFGPCLVQGWRVLRIQYTILLNGPGQLLALGRLLKCPHPKCSETQRLLATICCKQSIHWGTNNWAQ